MPIYQTFSNWWIPNTIIQTSLVLSATCRSLVRFTIWTLSFPTKPIINTLFMENVITVFQCSYLCTIFISVETDTTAFAVFVKLGHSFRWQSLNWNLLNFAWCETINEATPSSVIPSEQNGPTVLSLIYEIKIFVLWYNLAIVNGFWWLCRLTN